MKKLIISILIFITLAIPTSAFYFDSALVNLWNRRPDLQKAFPGDPTNNAKLDNWAKKYGWKENPDLYNYYPDKAIVERIAAEQYNLQLKSLEARISQLENNNHEAVKGNDIIVERIIQKPVGHVIKCCGSKTSAWLKCNQEIQDKDCSKGERTPGDGYAVYLYAE